MPLAGLIDASSISKATLIYFLTLLFFLLKQPMCSWASLTKIWFLSRCNDIWVAAGHPTMPSTSHAFRTGGATELLLEGVHPDIVATQGRWKSCALLDYWRQIKSILPLFIFTAINFPIAITRLQSVVHDSQHTMLYLAYNSLCFLLVTCTFYLSPCECTMLHCLLPCLVGRVPRRET